MNLDQANFINRPQPVDLYHSLTETTNHHLDHGIMTKHTSIVDRNIAEQRMSPLYLLMRRPVEGEESTLIQSFVTELLSTPTPKGYKRLVFRELRVGSRFPDLLIIHYHENRMLQRDHFRRSLGENEIRLLYALVQLNGANLDDVSRAIGLPRPIAHQSIENLMLANVLRLRGRKYYPRSFRRILGIQSIAAVEAKIDKTEAVARQAHFNLQITPMSLALMPLSRQTSKMSLFEESLGIRIITPETRLHAMEFEGQLSALKSLYWPWWIDHLVGKWVNPRD